MPRTEWSFLMRPEDHTEVKWLLSFLKAKFTVWGQIIFGMILVGMAMSSVGTQVSAFFLPSLIVALFITAGTLSLFFKPSVEAVRILPNTPTAGGACVFRVMVTNTGKTPLRNFEVFDHRLPYGLYSDQGHPDQKNFIDWLEPGKQAVLTLAWRIPRRGTFDIQPLLAASSFPTGLIRSIRRVAGRDQFIVFPQLIKYDDIPVLLPQKFQLGGSISSSRLGSSNEFLSTREYREGDRLRDVHWNSSARAGKLIVKEYTDEYFIRAGIFLDTELKRFEKHKCFETKISLCAGIAETFSNRNYLVDLFLSDRHALHVQAGRGKDQFHHLLEMLSAIEGDNAAHFEGALSKIKERARELSMIFLLLKDWDAPRAAFVQAVREFNVLTGVIIVRDKPLSLAAKDASIRVYKSQPVRSALG